MRFPLPSAELAANNKAYGHGWDFTLKVKNDPELCFQLHGVSGLRECHFESTVWKDDLQRAAYERTVMGGCPVWQWKNNDFPLTMPCEQVFDNVLGCSCDHFGRPQHFDDPQTPEFEGEPAECGNQRDSLGHPTAGFFTIAHGKGYLRGCIPGTGICGPWKFFEK